MLAKAPAVTSASRTEARVHLGSTQWFYCVSVHVGGTRQDKEDGKAEEVEEEVTKSCSGSLTAGLQILHLHSALPALLTDALMKDKTELERRTRADVRARSHTLCRNGRKTRLLGKGHFIVCDSKG